jgi:hypothetical protein
MVVKEYGVGLAVQYCAKNQFWWWLNHGMGWHQESTTFERATNERATKESRNMSAATKERSDKRAPRQKSAATKERRDKLA